MRKDKKKEEFDLDFNIEDVDFFPDDINDDIIRLAIQIEKRFREKQKNHTAVENT